MFKHALRSVKRVMTGRVVARFDSTANGGFTQLSFRLKESRDERFVMLAVKSAAHSQFVDLTLAEFEQLAAAVDRVRAALAEPGSSQQST